MVRIPERKYMQTLIAGRISSALFIDDLQTRKIPIPKEKDILELRDELVSSNPEYFSNPAVEADPDWLKSWGLSPLFYFRFQKPTDVSLKGCEGAYRMMEDPRMMKYMNLLAFAGASQEDIEIILNSKYNISYETEDFTMFLRYFANYEGWTFNDKELYSDALSDPDQRKLYKLAIKGDRAQLVWELGLGSDPTLSMDDLLRDMFTDSYFYFKKNVKLRPDDAQKFAGLAVKISDRLESMQDKKQSSQDLIGELKVKLQNKNTLDDPKQTIINIGDLHVELPPPTTESISDLTALMNEDVKDLNQMEKHDDGQSPENIE